MAKYTEEQKLKALGLISQDVPLRKIQDQLGLSYQLLLKWRKNFQEEQIDNEITKVVDAKPILVRKIAAEIANDMYDIQHRDDDPGFKDLSAFVDKEPEPEWLPAKDEKKEKELQAVSGELISGVEGYQKLSTKLQDGAMVLTEKIMQQAEMAAGPVELNLLVDALTKIQSSFFNKNVTNINVLNQNSNGNSNSGGMFGGFKNKD